MDYTTFKKFATEYAEDNFGGLSVLSTYNKLVQDKVHSHMLNLMMKGCGQNGAEIKNVMKKCAEFEKRFYEECLK